MDYDGLYRDLGRMSNEAARHAMRSVINDEANALKELRFAAECERLRDELFARGYGGY